MLGCCQHRIEERKLGIIKRSYIICPLLLLKGQFSRFSSKSLKLSLRLINDNYRQSLNFEDKLLESLHNSSVKSAFGPKTTLGTKSTFGNLSAILENQDFSDKKREILQKIFSKNYAEADETFSNIRSAMNRYKKPPNSSTSGQYEVSALLNINTPKGKF